MEDQWLASEKFGETEGYLLLCPVCKFTYTQHGDVTIYSRKKEDGPERTIHLGLTPVPASNPSPRRDAIGIHVLGECGHSFEILLIQHKGQTFFSFREKP